MALAREHGGNLVHVQPASPNARFCNALRLTRTVGLVAIFAVAAGVLANPPVARAYDYDYYIWCLDAAGSAGYCCSQAGGVLSEGTCKQTVPSAAPPYVPPGGGIIVP